MWVGWFGLMLFIIRVVLIVSELTGSNNLVPLWHFSRSFLGPKFTSIPNGKIHVFVKHYAPGGNIVKNKKPKGPHIVHLSTMCNLVEKVSAIQMPGWPSCFTDQPKKHKLSRGRWDLASCQVSLNSVQQFQRRSKKWLSQSEARAAILFFRSAKKTQTW